MMSPQRGKERTIPIMPPMYVCEMKLLLAVGGTHLAGEKYILKFLEKQKKTDNLLMQVDVWFEVINTEV